MDFLLVLTELFFVIGVTAEAPRANIDWKSAFFFNGVSLPQKLQAEGVAPHQPFFSLENYLYRMNDLSCGIRMWAQVSFLLSQSTHLTDRRTDGQKGLGNIVRCIRAYMQSHGKNIQKKPKRCKQQFYTALQNTPKRNHQKSLTL